MSANTQWIWVNGRNENAYVEFRKAFSFCGKQASLKIAADRQFAAFVNGKMVANAQFADAHGYKSATTKDITSALCEGENILTVIAVHADRDFALARTTEAGLFFEVYVDGKLVAASDSSVDARVSPSYKVGVPVTPQLGYGYEYDFMGDCAWEKAIVAPSHVLVDRPIKNCVLSEPLPSEVIAQGVFMYRDGETAAERAQNAWLSSLRFAEMTGVNRVEKADFKEPLRFAAKGGDGVFVLVDLGRETAGYACFSIEVPSACKGILVWGEHLTDLRVRAAVGGRHFAAPFTFKVGKNQFDEYLHRLGARYLCLFIESDEVTVEQLTVRAFEYPFRVLPRKFDDRLLEKIYHTGVRTLQLCAHEHYEDCPWREQALYGMDSRNQMLYGYGAFHEYEFPRATLSLMGKCMREDGLSFLCPPSTLNLVIPSFSAYWILAVCDNVKADFQLDFVKEILPSVEKCLKAFQKKTRNKVLNRFGEKEYWNFHEWSKGLEGAPTFRDYEIEEYPDGLLTAVVYRAAKGASEIEKAVGNEKLATELIDWANELAEGLHTFYDEEKGLFASYVKEGERFGYHEYTQALMLSTGVLDKAKQERICDVLTKGHSELTPTTFAGLPIKYEALSACSNAAEYIKKDICEKFGAMLFKGATSYWETADGEEDFSGAGSLCHGWSAAACYALDTLYKVQIEK